MANRAYNSYVICTSPRSGSTLLCGLLSATGCAGDPDFHFHTPSLQAWLDSYDLNRAGYATDRDATGAVFAAALRRGTNDTGIFGLRLQHASLGFFLQQATLLYPDETGDMCLIRRAFGTTLFIHLVRADKLAQAVSLVTAQQSGLWHRAADGTELERLAPWRVPVFDRSAISRAMQTAVAADAAWRDWFTAQNVQPLEVTYDDLSTDPTGVLGRILARLGRDPTMAQGTPIPTRRLAGATSAEWIRRYRAAPPDRP